MSDLLTPLATEPVLSDLRATLRPFAVELVTTPIRANHAKAKKSRAVRAAIDRLRALGMSQREAADAADVVWWDEVREAQGARRASA